MKMNYKCVIVGCGGIGSSAAFWSARRVGSEVLALEQFEIGHPHGGSLDHSRIIRLSYHHEDYTRLAPHAYAAWAVLERESAVQIVTKTGGVQIAEKQSPYSVQIETYANAMDAASIPYERFDGDELKKRYPQFSFDQELEVLFQADTGIADPRKGTASHVAMARYYGATIIEKCRVLDIHPFNGGVDLNTECGRITCGTVIVTAGAWTDPVLAGVGTELGLTITQEQVTYYATPFLAKFAVGKFPIFLWHGEKVIYGFPVYGEVATKAAIDASGPVVSAESRTYEPDEEREQQLETWLRQHVPEFVGPKMYTKTCLYTMPRDRNFLIDKLPGYPQIVVCVGAGHAYKFASLFGKILSELAIDGKTSYPIAPFNVQRPAISDPSYVPHFHI